MFFLIKTKARVLPKGRGTNAAAPPPLKPDGVMPRGSKASASSIISTIDIEQIFK